MDSEKLKNLLSRVPVGLLVGAFLAYLVFDYYTFMNDPGSELNTRIAEMGRLRQEAQKLQEKLKAGQEFFRTLEAKRNQLREMARKLDEMKGTLTEDIDVGEFMKTSVTEAKKVGLKVVSLKPGRVDKKEFYEEKTFSMVFRGVYVQLLVFLERMSNVQKIVRVDDFALKPTGSQRTKLVELEGAIELKTYRYLASKADEIGRGEAKQQQQQQQPQSPASSTPAAAGKPTEAGR